MARIRDIGSGLWVWSREHPDWTPDSDFEGPVTSTCVTSGGEVVLLELGWGVAGARETGSSGILQPFHVKVRTTPPRDPAYAEATRAHRLTRPRWPGFKGLLSQRVMSAHLHVLTERLDLRRTDPVGDLDALFAVFSDPDGWWYDPGSRHTDRARTRDWLTRAAARFDEDGLSYWTVRRLDTGAIIGVGGAQRQHTLAWNLNYRLATAHQGQGFASELTRAARAAAAEVDDSVPFMAWIAPHNTPSIKVAERLGLTSYGVHTDPSDGQSRLAYADRPLGDLLAEATRRAPGTP
jgi:RimJ/RimL family protein N-acetyltransferase